MILVLKVLLVPMEPMALPDPPVRRVQLELLVPMEHKVFKVQSGLKAIKVTREIRVMPDLLVRRVQLEPMVHKVFKAKLVLRVPRASPVQLELTEPMERMELQVPPVRQERMGHKVFKVFRAIRGR